MKLGKGEPEFDDYPESGPVSLAEARRMVFVYRHLVRLEQELFDTLAKMIPTMPREAQREAEKANLPVISSHVTRFRERLDYWISRERELERKKRD
jgi:hypothetical protein